MNETLEEILKKLNEALELAGDYLLEAEIEDLDDLPFCMSWLSNQLEDTIEPLSDMWQATH